MSIAYTYNVRRSTIIHQRNITVPIGCSCVMNQSTRVNGFMNFRYEKWTSELFGKRNGSHIEMEFHLFGTIKIRKIHLYTTARLRDVVDPWFLLSRNLKNSWNYLLYRHRQAWLGTLSRKVSWTVNVWCVYLFHNGDFDEAVGKR